MVITSKMDTPNQTEIMYRVIWILQSACKHGKVMYPTIPFPAMSE